MQYKATLYHWVTYKMSESETLRHTNSLYIFYDRSDRPVNPFACIRDRQSRYSRSDAGAFSDMNIYKVDEYLCVIDVAVAPFTNMD